ncbi:putative cytochrome c biogenesis ccmf-like mitochondrial protein [Phtheirospermum japonicum]|uniref:Putative cytochrome c biogenesis ccmf-like mitochondrial protein n=1 Tax=Phtheirospermum japonicum TaxID=374723 RepID=A0A830C2A5_9LAMI|nr:putative cytochrome c biogenesis ccmf-like mitochondrial protein [Phtheirospermum japonicum]
MMNHFVPTCCQSTFRPHMRMENLSIFYTFEKGRARLKWLYIQIRSGRWHPDPSISVSPFAIVAGQEKSFLLLDNRIHI